MLRDTHYRPPGGRLENTLPEEFGLDFLPEVPGDPASNGLSMPTLPALVARTLAPPEPASKVTSPFWLLSQPLQPLDALSGLEQENTKPAGSQGRSVAWREI